MIEVVIADRQELFRRGLVEILAVAEDVRIVGQPQSPEELWSALQEADPHVLILSTNFLPVISKIEQELEQHQTALLLLAEENDWTAYLQWLPAQGIVYRSVDECTFVDAVRRVARGDLFVQERTSDTREDRSEVA